MPPRKGTKDYQNEIIRVYYGINNQTLGVQSVWETRGGKLASMSAGHHFRHQCVAGNIAHSHAVSVAFDLRVGLEKVSTISISCKASGEHADVGDGDPRFC
ncbi:hypothetical protein [Sinorhizobium meliloti]|uniref:hypothetical protein n=1 Tax=Rhizobium meliloti TaxID=382 RepID=UPI00398921A9